MASTDRGLESNEMNREVLCGMAAIKRRAVLGLPHSGSSNASPWGILGNYSCPDVSHRAVYVLAMDAESEAMVEKERPLSNYSSSDETKREQRREFDNGHPQRNRLTCVEGGSNRLLDVRNASASMHNAP